MTPETQALRATVRRAVETGLRALCAEVDRTQQFSPELWRRLTELGIVAIPFAPEYGGAGGSFVDYVAAVEELARAGVLAANLPGTSVQVASVLLRFGHIMFGIIWLVIWVWTNGPMRIFNIRWRFFGGRLV